MVRSKPPIKLLSHFTSVGIDTGAHLKLVSFGLSASAMALNTSTISRTLRLDDEYEVMIQKEGKCAWRLQE
jgi:hypothetical protein